MTTKQVLIDFIDQKIKSSRSSSGSGKSLPDTYNSSVNFSLDYLKKFVNKIFGSKDDMNILDKYMERISDKINDAILDLYKNSNKTDTAPTISSIHELPFVTFDSNDFTSKDAFYAKYEEYRKGIDADIRTYIKPSKGTSSQLSISEISEWKKIIFKVFLDFAVEHRITIGIDASTGVKEFKKKDVQEILKGLTVTDRIAWIQRQTGDMFNMSSFSEVLNMAFLVATNKGFKEELRSDPDLNATSRDDKTERKRITHEIIQAYIDDIKLHPEKHKPESTVIGVIKHEFGHNINWDDPLNASCLIAKKKQDIYQYIKSIPALAVSKLKSSTPTGLLVQLAITVNGGKSIVEERLRLSISDALTYLNGKDATIKFKDTLKGELEERVAVLIKTTPFNIKKRAELVEWIKQKLPLPVYFECMNTATISTIIKYIKNIRNQTDITDDKLNQSRSISGLIYLLFGVKTAKVTAKEFTKNMVKDVETCVSAGPAKVKLQADKYAIPYDKTSTLLSVCKNLVSRVMLYATTKFKRTMDAYEYKLLTNETGEKLRLRLFRLRDEYKLPPVKSGVTDSLGYLINDWFKEFLKARATGLTSIGGLINKILKQGEITDKEAMILKANAADVEVLFKGTGIETKSLSDDELIGTLNKLIKKLNTDSSINFERTQPSVFTTPSDADNRLYFKDAIPIEATKPDPIFASSKKIRTSTKAVSSSRSVIHLNRDTIRGEALPHGVDTIRGTNANAGPVIQPFTINPTPEIESDTHETQAPNAEHGERDMVL